LICASSIACSRAARSCSARRCLWPTTHLYRFFELEIERPSLPQVERWYHTLQQRAPYRAHVMLPFEELRGRLLDQ
jgi:hypothetical protein